MKNDQQLVIVGGGPVGTGLAVELGLRDISCALVERRKKIQRIPKGQNLMQRTMDHFYCWGLADTLRSARVMPPGYPIGGVTTYGNLMSDYWYVPQQREAVNDFFFQVNERLPQYCMEEVLRDKLKTLPSVETYFGWNAEAIEQADNTVNVSIANVDSQVHDNIEADYVVGCDGGRSMVRDAIGIERSGSDFDQKMVLAVFRSKELHERLKRFPERSTYRAMDPNLKGYWQFFGRIDVGEGWFFHAPVPLDTTVENYDFKALIEKAAGFEFECEFDHLSFWDLRIAVAETYQLGRIFIAGDAAHSHPPYGGFGLNNGLEDARNLGWKIAARLKGWGTDKLLASYSEERHPIFKETGENFIAARIEKEGKFFETYNPDEDLEAFLVAWEQKKEGTARLVTTYEPNYEGSSVIDGPVGGVSTAHGEHSFKARAGHHLAPLTLSSGKNVFEELGNDFNLLALDDEMKVAEAFEKAANELNVPLKIIHDTCADDREDYKARYILIRPDHYIVWSGDNEPKDVDQLLEKAVGKCQHLSGMHEIK